MVYKKRSNLLPPLHLNFYDMIFAQFTGSNDSSVMILYKTCLYTPCMTFIYSWYDPCKCCTSSFLPFLLTAGRKLKTLVYSRRYTALLVQNNDPLCSKFYGYPHHQNSRVNNFLSSYLTFQLEHFPKFVF